MSAPARMVSLDRYRYSNGHYIQVAHTLGPTVIMHNSYSPDTTSDITMAVSYVSHSQHYYACLFHTTCH